MSITYTDAPVSEFFVCLLFCIYNLEGVFVPFQVIAFARGTEIYFYQVWFSPLNLKKMLIHVLY